MLSSFFFFNDTATTEIYTLSLHDALPISRQAGMVMTVEFELDGQRIVGINGGPNFEFSEAVSLAITCEDQDEVDYYWEDRKSTRLNSSHANISYAVFCLKKKKDQIAERTT